MIEIHAGIIKQTAKAYYVNINGCHTSVWVPKSQLRNAREIEVKYADGEVAYDLVAEMPEWLWYKMPRKTGPVPWATRPW